MSRFGWGLSCVLVAAGMFFAVLAGEVHGSSDANAPIGVGLLIASAVLAFVLAGVVSAVSGFRTSRRRINDAKRRVE